MKTQTANSIEAMRGALAAEFGTDFSFIVLGRGHILAANNQRNGVILAKGASVGAPSAPLVLPFELVRSLADFVTRASDGESDREAAGAVWEKFRPYYEACKAVGREAPALAVPAPSDLLARFGAAVLEVLEENEEWSAQTLDAIAGEAFALKLANSEGLHGRFKRSALALGEGPPANPGASADVWLVLGKVRGEVVSVDLARGAEEMAAKSFALKPDVEMIPLNEARRAPALLARASEILQVFADWEREGGRYPEAGSLLSGDNWIEDCTVSQALAEFGREYASYEGAPVAVSAEAPARKALQRLERVSVETVKRGGPGVAQVLAHYSGGENASMAFGAVAAFHICPVCGWFVAENYGGSFWTIASNEDEFFPDLESARRWLVSRFAGA